MRSTTAARAVMTGQRIGAMRDRILADLHITRNAAPWAP